MKKITKFLVLSVVAMTMTSCYTGKLAVGQTTINEPVIEVNKVKNHALILGLVPLDNGHKASEFVNNNPNYVVKHQMSFIDGLLGFVTLGIYTPTTTTFYMPVPKNF
ncbi:Bor family protein [Myroides sp. LJL115]